VTLSGSTFRNTVTPSASATSAHDWPGDAIAALISLHRAARSSQCRRAHDESSCDELGALGAADCAPDARTARPEPTAACVEGGALCA
jgi:hypothetical protein